MAAFFLRDHPVLRPFLLSNARPTGRTIGTGSYGSVEEVAIPGAVCAAKKIHDLFLDPTRIPQEGIEKASQEFVRECQLMCTLRHPYIVQFLGVCFLPGSWIPALVMEKLVTSLHDVLDPEPSPPTKTFIPLSLKRSVLQDVACGLSFLHSHSPPIIHRDLSARNVLLNEGMVAKISDLGMARIMPRLKAATMTKAPGASIYMPPEALEDKSKYDVTIDIFSLGVLAIFVLSQTFPNPQAAAYMNGKGQMLGRTELERRGKYVQPILEQLQKGHPLVQMIQHCLKNRMKERPTIQQVLQWLEQARAEIDDSEYDMDKLSLTQLLKSKEEELEQQKKQTKIQRGQVTAQKTRNKSLQENIEDLRHQVECLEEQVESLQTTIASLKKARKATPPAPPPKPLKSPSNNSLPSPVTLLSLSLPPAVPPKPPKSPKPRTSSVTSVQSLQGPLSIQWRKGKKAPTNVLMFASSVTINGMVYCGGNDVSNVVTQFIPGSGDWMELSRTPVRGFAMTLLQGQLVLVGGGGGDTKIRVWDSWVQAYSPMSIGRDQSAAVGYQKYLIVACGYPYRSEVEVLDSLSGRWLIAPPVPVGGHLMSSVVVDDCWYLSSFGQWQDGKEHIFQVNLPTLVSRALPGHTNNNSIWHKLPTPPVEHPSLLAFRGHLLAVGGNGYVQKIHCYDPETRQWREYGQLPVGMYAPCCAVLPSGDLMVAGGMTGDSKAYSKRVWIGHIDS